MDKIEVKVLTDTYNDSKPGEVMSFLGRLTQRGHNIKSMNDLDKLWYKETSEKLIEQLAATKHGTIKRFTPITIAIVGASRRFLAQARTHQVGMNYVSASLQYSDYTGKADFVVPYCLMGTKHEAFYLNACEEAMDAYRLIAKATDNDTAGYAAPQGLRNILIMQGNHQAWAYFVSLRSCNRNTVETQYVTMKIWEALLRTCDGELMFSKAGPDCLFGHGCQEGKMYCGNPFELPRGCGRMNARLIRDIIKEKWPLLNYPEEEA